MTFEELCQFYKSGGTNALVAMERAAEEQLRHTRVSAAASFLVIFRTKFENPDAAGSLLNAAHIFRAHASRRQIVPVLSRAQSRECWIHFR